MNSNLKDIILDNENLIYSIINKYGNYYEIEDLYQVGVIGMIKAYYNYNNSYNTKFTSYAYTYILGEVLKYVNGNKDIKLNKEYLSLGKKINEAKTILTQKLMKEPSNYELSVFLEIDEKIIDEVLFANIKFDSLDKAISEDGKKLFLEDVIPSSKDEYNIDKILLNDEINSLSYLEKELVKKRYFEDKTQSETASYLGINQVQVYRNEKKILKKLKDKMVN